MKKYFVCSVLIITLALTACSKKDAQETGGTVQKTEAQALTSLLPEDTEVYVTFSSLESVYTHLSITPSSVLGSPTDIPESSAVIGLNVLNLDELKTAGIDTQKPVAIALTGITLDEAAETPQFTGLLLVPVLDAKKAVAAITAAFEKEDSGFTVTQDDTLTVYTNAEQRATLYLAVKDDYLLLGGNPGQNAGQDAAKSVFTAILSGESALADSPNFKEVTAGIHANDDVFVYANIAAVTQQNSEAFAQLLHKDSELSGVPAIGGVMAYLEDFQAFGASLDLKSPDFTIHSILTMTDDARSKKLWEGVQIDKTAALGIAESPALMVSWAVNVVEYYRQLSEIAANGADAPETNPLDGPLGAFEAMSGIDVEDELVKNLGGNVNLAIYDGSTITMANYNTLLSLTVTDEAAMRQVLDKAIKAMPAPQQSMITTQTVDGVNAYVAMAGMTQVFFGIHDKQVILATSKPMFQKALAGKVNDGFTAGMEPKELAETLKSTGNLFYLNVDEIVKAARNFEMFLQGIVGGTAGMQKIYGIAEKFEYALSSTQLKGNTIATDIQVKTRFTNPFFIEMVTLIQDYKAQ